MRKKLELIYRIYRFAVALNEEKAKQFPYQSL